MKNLISLLILFSSISLFSQEKEFFITKTIRVQDGSVTTTDPFIITFYPESENKVFSFKILDIDTNEVSTILIPMNLEIESVLGGYSFGYTQKTNWVEFVSETCSDNGLRGNYAIFEMGDYDNLIVLINPVDKFIYTSNTSTGVNNYYYFN